MSGLETSRTLLERARARDPRAWDRLVELYAPLVLHWLRGAGLDDEEAKDVFQEVFQATARHLQGFRKERPADTFRGWLRTITRNKANDHFRRRDREPRGVGGTELRVRLEAVPAPALAADDDGDEEDGSRAGGDADEGEVFLVRRAMEGVKKEFRPRTWRVFERCVLDGQSPRDVAVELSMSAGAVRVAKSRVLRRLRDELGDDERRP